MTQIFVSSLAARFLVLDMLERFGWREVKEEIGKKKVGRRNRERSEEMWS